MLSVAQLTGRGSRSRRARFGGSILSVSGGSLRLVRDDRFIVAVVDGGFTPARSAGSARGAAPWWSLVSLSAVCVVLIVFENRRR